MELPSDAPSWLGTVITDAREEAINGIRTSPDVEALWTWRGQLQMVEKIVENIESIVADDIAKAREALAETVSKERIA
jgi:hypothetical protein